MDDATRAKLEATWDRVGTVALRLVRYGYGGAPGDQLLEDLLTLREACDALRAERDRWREQYRALFADVQAGEVTAQHITIGYEAREG